MRCPLRPQPRTPVDRPPCRDLRELRVLPPAHLHPRRPPRQHRHRRLRRHSRPCPAPPPVPPCPCGQVDPLPPPAPRLLRVPSRQQLRPAIPFHPRVLRRLEVVVREPVRPHP